MNHTPYRAVTKGFENPAQVVNSKRETIAVIYSDVEGGDQYENARLFAAAPDLLAALESLNAAVIRAGHGNTAMPELSQAWAAIAKATGETKK